MQSTKAKDLRDLSDDELVGFIAHRSQSIYRLECDLAFRRSNNTASKQTMRHDIARAKTILGERRRHPSGMRSNHPPELGARSSSASTSVTAPPVPVDGPSKGNNLAAFGKATSSVESMVPKGGQQPLKGSPQHRPAEPTTVVGIWFEPVKGDDSLMEAVPCDLVFSVGSYGEVGGDFAPYRGPRPVRAIATVFSSDFDFDHSSLEFTVPVDVRSDEVRFRVSRYAPERSRWTL